MEITCLIENTNMHNDPKLATESGLALLIEDSTKKILFDTGVSNKFMQNAQFLNKTLDNIHTCVISHGHFDHTGGLNEFLNLNPETKVYFKEGADNTFYFKLGFLRKNIGVPPEVFENHGTQIEFLKEKSKVADGVDILTDINQIRPLANGNKKLMKLEGGKVIRDDFDHELIGVLQHENELIVITGCSHNGILNMIDTVKSNYPGKKIKAVVGGFHLMGIPLLKNSMSESPETIEKLAKELLSYDIPIIYTNHCTGTRAYNIMKKIMGDRLEYLTTGQTIKF